jgi:hypothetical protein
MLRDEIEKYTKLSGNDGWHTPIGIIGAYLDGYEKGLNDMAKDILHKAIDNTSMAEDAYPGIKEKLHAAIEEDIPMEYFESGGTI